MYEQVWGVSCREGYVCQQSISWAVEQKLCLFSQSRGWLSWLLLRDGRALAAYSLDVTYCIGSVCGWWGLSGWRDNTHCPARSLGRHRKYGSPQIRLTVHLALKTISPGILVGSLASFLCHHTVIKKSCSFSLERCILIFPVFLYSTLAEKKTTVAGKLEEKSNQISWDALTRLSSKKTHVACITWYIVYAICCFVKHLVMCFVERLCK